MPAPRFVVVIGANGAGKSTWCTAHRDELPRDFYDADSIANQLGSYDDPADQRKARAIVDENIAHHFDLHESFGFESTYSGASRPRIARRAHELGYSTFAIFVGTHHPAINIRRVAARVQAEIGHRIPESEVRRRWTAAQDNLVATASVFDHIRLLDNSEDEPLTVAEFIGRSQLHRAVDAPPWAARLSVALIRGRFPDGSALSREP